MTLNCEEPSEPVAPKMGRLFNWLNRHSTIRRALMLGAGAVIAADLVTLGVTGHIVWTDYQKSDNISASQTASQTEDEARQLAAGKYVLEDLAKDWESNRQHLMEFEQHKSQSRVISSLTHRIDKTAAETGQLTVAVYNMSFGDENANYDPAELERITNTAFERMNIKIKFIYEDIDPYTSRASQFPEGEREKPEVRQLIEQDIKNFKTIFSESPVEEAPRNSGITIVSYTPEGGSVTKQYSSLREPLEEIIGKDRLVAVRGPQTQPDEKNNIVDAIVVLSNFADSKTAGISIHGTDTENDAYILVDKINRKLQASTEIIALYMIHELGHKLGLDHSDFPLDVMSYADGARYVIMRFPELAFGPESLSEWNSIVRDYEAIKKANESVVKILLPPSQVCANVPLAVSSTAPLRNTRLEVIIGTDPRGGGGVYRGELQEGHKYVSAITTLTTEGTHYIKAVVFKGDASITSESQEISVVNCGKTLDEFAKIDRASGNIAKLSIDKIITAGSKTHYTINSKGGAYEATIVVIDDTGRKVSSQWAGSSGHEPVTIDFKVDQPGKYAMFALVTGPKNEPELLYRVFEAR